MPRTKAPSWGDISFTETRMGAYRRRQGLAGLRDRTLRAFRLACGDLAGGPPPTGAPSSPAPQQDQTAPGTPAGPQTQTQTQTQQSGPEPLGSGPPSMLSGCQRCATGVGTARQVSALRDRCQHCATGVGAARQVITSARQVSSARPPCRPCRSSRR